MTKDPAVLFYTADFIAGTITMSDEQRGKYILLLCLQHQKGFLTEKDMLNICKTYDFDIWEKFIKEGDLYYNERMRRESEKRAKYSESRRINRQKGEAKKEDMLNICKTYDKHMENENINININNNKDKGGMGGKEKEKKEEIDISPLPSVSEIIELYHSICESFPVLKFVSEARKEKIRTRVREMKDLETIKTVFTKMEASKFLKGDNDRKWKATFDWLFDNSKNWVKIYEGNYDNKEFKLDKSFETPKEWQE